MIENQLDARPLQMKLLEFESRGLKPMALALLDDGSHKKKIAAIVAASTMLTSLQAAPAAYFSSIATDASPDVVSGVDEALGSAFETFDGLAALVNERAHKQTVIQKLEQLFELADYTHTTLETEAKKAGARLMGDGEIASQAADAELSHASHRKLSADPKAIGSGGKQDQLVRWLSSIAKTDSNVIAGGGGKDPLVRWLAGVAQR
jgi:hypothetical protein